MIVCQEANGWYVVVGSQGCILGPHRWRWLAELHGLIFLLWPREKIEPTRTVDKELAASADEIIIIKLPR